MDEQPRARWTIYMAILAAACFYHTYYTSTRLSDADHLVASAWCGIGCFLAGVAALLLAVAPAGRKRLVAASLIAVGLFGAVSQLRLAYIESPKYTTDSILYCHYAAQQQLDGENPWAGTVYPDAHDVLGVDRKFHSSRSDGKPDDIYPYPAGSFLALVPFVHWGMSDVRLVYVACMALCALLLMLALPGDDKLAPLLLLTVYPLLYHLTVGSVTDSMWAMFAIPAWLLLGRRPWVSALLMGLALTIKQPPWVAMPFYAVAAWTLHDGRRAAGLFGVAGVTFLAVNAHWIAMDWRPWLDGVTSPFLHPLEATGYGLHALQKAGVIAVSRTAVGVISIGLYVGLLGLFAWRRNRLLALAPVLAYLPAFLSWRSQTNHFFMLPLLLLAGLALKRRD